MENSLVSILIPTFNSEKFIADALLSVQNQTFQNWEIIIVDDASTDQTVALISKIAQSDARIKWFQLSKNSGTGVARNTALIHATGRYIAFLDADDLWKPYKLQKQLNFMQTNAIPFTFSAYDCMNEEGDLLNLSVVPPQNLSYRQLFFCNYVGNLTGIYDTDFFGKIEILSKRKRQDWMHWLTLLKKIKMAKAVPESLAIYRVRANSISASKIDLVKHNFAVYKQYHRYNWIMALSCMMIFLVTQLMIKPFYIKKVPAQT
ncbi:glycosyltransferase family 2 protein [Flavobacterium sp. 7A]|uniref:glycosyltransferase family 2 protein n=1 Tax=Flavobacterium sp. 7A TaxID=2940571 RepID=UPI0022278930|nr:glycosyltransferase family 2 protein [Flavobacterium sp. 7A]MCW2117958.1 glycosyltransferase involved in cell wall biosynthesis [Flavobacterium sp. 7A]